MDPIDTSKPPTATQVRELWERCDKALLEDRRHYWLNRSFYAGQQWLRWDHDSRRPTMMSDEKVSNLTVINKIAPPVENLMGRLCKRDLAFESQIKGTDDVAQRGGKLAEHILESDRRTEGWEEERTNVVFACLMGGTAIGCIEWDADRGQVVTQDPASGDDLHLGGVRMSGLTIAEASLEPYSRRQSDATYWMKASALTIEQAMETYNLSKPPAADGTAASSPLQGRLLASSDGEKHSSMCVAITMYKKPTRNGKGYVVTVLGDDTVAQVPTWPFSFEQLNCYAFRLIASPDIWTGTTFVSSCRGPQFHYNLVRSISLDHADKVTNARMWVPDGYLDDIDELSNDTGEVLQYHPQENGDKAYWMDPPNYERQPAQEAERISAEIDDIMHTHGTTQGELVGDRNSGLALSLVAEKDDSPLGVFARDQANGWGRIGSLAAQTYEANAIEQRTTRVQSANKVVIQREWKGADLHGQTDIIVPLDATYPHSRVAHQAMMTNIAQMFPQAFAGVDAITLAKILDLPNMDNMPGILDPDRKRAAWENEMLAEEYPVHPEPWHNHAVHLSDHNAQRNDPSYEAWTDTARQYMELHIQGHETMAAEEVATQGKLEQAAPGLSQLPQGDNPPGSAVPPALSVIQGGAAAGAPPQPPQQQPGQPPAPQQGAVG